MSDEHYSETVSREASIAVRKGTLLNVLIAVLTALMVLLFLLNVKLGAEVRSEPQALEINEAYEATWDPDAVRLLESWTPTEKTTRWFLREFIKALRATPDEDVDQSTLLKFLGFGSVYYIEGQIVADYLENHPEKVTEKIFISDDDIVMTKQGPYKWTVAWVERKYDLSGNFQSKTTYDGVFELGCYTDARETDLMYDPAGLYVTYYDFDIRKER